MTFKFKFPVKFARWTKEEFDVKRQNYAAKHGYEIYLPGISDIFRWEAWKEPDVIELDHYKHGRVAKLGEKRYDQISKLMKAKREKYLRILSSPSPRFLMNSASVLTLLDDCQDMLGTAAVVARTGALLFPRTIGRFLTGPAGWLLTASDIVNVAVQLSRLPWKARRLQHDFHTIMKHHPFSKKAKLRRLNKLKRIKLSVPEAIEALQVTDNAFGYGLKLGPIAGLLYDIPSGFYRAFQGRKVRVTGLPSSFYWVDYQIARFFRGCAQLWYGNPTINDRELGQTMVALNFATQWQRAFIQDTSALDYIDDPSGIEVPVPHPIHPSTIDIIKSEVGSVENNSGWPMTNSLWMNTNVPFNQYGDEIQDNIKSWYQRNKRSSEGHMCNQNAIEAGLNVLSNLEGEDSIEWTYSAVPLALLKMFNCNYRFPLDITDAQVKCFTAQLQAYDSQDLEPDIQDILSTASNVCGFDLTTEVPERASGDYAHLVSQYKTGIHRLKKWYFEQVFKIALNLCFRVHWFTSHNITEMKRQLPIKLSWLNHYGWPPGEPSKHISTLRPTERSCVEGKLA